MEAYITLLTNNSYASGALVLAHSLRASQTSKQLAILVTNAVSRSIRDRLAAVYDSVIEIGEINSYSEKNLQLLGRPELGVTLTKIHVFNQTQYSKLVFLDADTLVLRNVDDLFDKTANGGTAEGDDKNKRFAAAPDAGWPDCFNSGVFVCRPSYQDYTGLIEMASHEGTFDGGDQGLLNSYFSGWSTGDSSNRLPFLYNTTPTSVYSYAPAFQQYKDKLNIVHFVGSFKPWQWLRFADGTVFPRNKSSADSITLVQQWWNVFDQYVGGKPSDIHEVSHGYELPPGSQWDHVGLDGKPEEREAGNKNHYDGWFQPYDYQLQQQQQQQHKVDHGDSHQHHHQHHEAVQVPLQHDSHHEQEHKHRDSSESWFAHNPHHLTDYHYQPEPEPQQQPQSQRHHHHHHHNRHDSAFDFNYTGFQNAWDIDEDPRKSHPPLYYEQPIEIIEEALPRSDDAASPYPSGKGRPVFPWESHYASGGGNATGGMSKSRNSSIGMRTPSRVYYNYNATAEERQEHLAWEAARRQEIEEHLYEQYRLQDYARYERDRVIAEAQERVRGHQALESFKLVNAWDVDLGVQISILQKSERSLRSGSRPGTRNSSRRNSVVLARGLQQEQLREQYDAELAKQRREEEARWQREQEEARLKEEDERIQKLRLTAKKASSLRVTAAMGTAAGAGIAIEGSASEYEFRNVWDPPDMAMRKKKITIEDEEVTLALPLRQNRDDRRTVSIRAQDATGQAISAVASDTVSHRSMHRASAKGKHTDEYLTAVATAEDSSFSTSSSLKRVTTAGSHRFVRTTINTSITHRQFMNGIEVSSSTSSGSAGGEVMFEIPAGMRSLPYFIHGRQSTMQRSLQEPSQLSTQSLSARKRTVASTEEQSSAQPEIIWTTMSSLNTQGGESRELKKNQPLSIDIGAASTEPEAIKRIDLRDTLASEAAVVDATRVLTRYPQATSRYAAQNMTMAGSSSAADERLYAADPNLAQMPVTTATQTVDEEELEELEYFGERHTHAALPLGSPYMPSTPLVSTSSHRFSAAGFVSGYSSRAGSQPTTPGPSTPSRFGPSTPKGATTFKRPIESSSGSRAGRAGATSSSSLQSVQQPYQQGPVDQGFSNYKIEWNWRELLGKKPRHWSAEGGQDYYDPYNALSTHGSSAESDEERRGALQSSDEDDEDDQEEDDGKARRGGSGQKGVAERRSSTGEEGEFSRESGFVIRGGKIARRRSSVSLEQREF